MTIAGQRVRPWDNSGLEGDDPEPPDPEPPDGVYGHWYDDKNGAWVLPNHVGYSDYSGGMVERSNYEEFVEQFAEHEDVEWIRVHGGHGTLGILVRADADERVSEIGDFFDALESYPLANEERYSELEMEATNEAWADYGLNDFIRDLDVEVFGRDLTEADEELTVDEEQVRGNLTRLYYALVDLYSEYPEVEDAGTSVAFHTSEIASRLKSLAEDLNAAGEAGNREERLEAEEGTYGVAVLEEMLMSALSGPEADPRQFEYGGHIYRVLAGHRDLRHGGREVLTDVFREQGLEAGLKFLEKKR